MGCIPRKTKTIIEVNLKKYNKKKIEKRKKKSFNKNIPRFLYKKR